MNSLIKGTIISFGSAILSFGISFSTQIKFFTNDSTSNNVINSNNNNNDTIERIPLTSQQKYLNSLGGTQGFSAEADIDIKISDTISLHIDGSVNGDASDMSDIKLDGTACAIMDDASIKIDFSYFDSTVYFSFYDSYFKMETDGFIDFVNKLSQSYGVSFELPSSLTNLSLENIESIFLNMPDKVKREDTYIYTATISEDIIIDFKSTVNDEFVGLMTSFIYEGVEISLDVNLEQFDPKDLSLVSPLEGKNKDKYQDFAPIYTLFDGIYSLTKNKTNTINADINITKDDKDFIYTNVDISYDLDNKIYSLAGDIKAHSKYMPYGFCYKDETIYADYSSLHVSISNSSVSKLVDFFSTKVGSSELDKVLNTITSLIENPNISQIVKAMNDGVGSITLTSEELSIGLFPSLMNDKLIDLDDVIITFKFDKNGLSYLDISEFSFDGYKAKVTLTFKDYKPYSLTKYIYESLDSVASLPDMLTKYAKQSEFAIEFDGKYSTSEDGANKELSIGNDKDDNPSFIQFTLDENRKILDEYDNTNDEGFGYGQVNIIDYDNYLHNIKVDLKSIDEVLFSYNSTMNGKMKIQTLKDLYALVKDITIDNPDDHMQEIINKIFDTTASLPIKDIINGDYTLLLTTNIVNSLKTSSTYIKMNLSLDILSMSHTSFDIKIEFESGDNPSLKALKLSNLNIDGITENKYFEFNAYLKDYDFSKDTSTTFRLDRNADYIDFGDLKVLLQLGINTSKYNYYHFDGSANLIIASIIKTDVPLDIKVWTKGDNNHNSDVEIDVYLKSIPTVTGFNGSTKSRNAHIYYHQNMFYVERTDVVTEWFKTKTKMYAGVYTSEYFFDNILQILLQDVMGFNDTVYGWIESSANSNDGYQIPCEKVLKDFKYNESDYNFYFDIDIEALSGNSDLKSLTLTARVDDSYTQLVSVDLHLGIKVGISISLDVTLNLLEDTSYIADDSNRLNDLESFESAHKNDALNQFNQI